MTEESFSSSPIDLATELTIAWLSNPNTRANAADVPEFLKAMVAAVQGLGTSASAEGPQQAVTGDHVPAVTARKSLSSPDHIISLIDGRPYKTLRRHLSGHGLTPEQYRERYKLKPDYPMVAPTYSEARRTMAKNIGLGQKGRAARSAPADEGSALKPAARRGPKPRTPKPE